MTDELHNHIAEMVCETDAPGKPADVTPGEIERSIWSAMIWAANQPPPPHGAAHPSYTDSGNSDAETECRRAASRIRAALAEQTARAEAAEARVAELTAKLEAPVQVGVKPECGHPFCGDQCGTPAPSPDTGMGKVQAERLTETQWAAIVAHFSYELEPRTPLPNWNTVAMEAIRLRNQLSAPSPDVPTPPDGWNVMKLGQVGWHVVQSANGWETSRIFGAECLLRSGGGDEFGPALDATPDGGRVAADAPTPSPDVGALVRDLLEGYGASYIDSETWEKVTTEAKAFLALAAQEGGE